MKNFPAILLAALFVASCTPPANNFFSDDLNLRIPVQGVLAVETPEW